MGQNQPALCLVSEIKARARLKVQDIWLQAFRKAAAATLYVPGPASSFILRETIVRNEDDASTRFRKFGRDTQRHH